MPGDPLQRRLLKFIRAHAMKHGSPIALDDLLAAFERSCASEDFDKAVTTLYRLDRIIVKDRDDGVAQVRSEGTNPDGTAVSCRFCGLPQGNLAMWQQAKQCKKRPRGGPCEPRWIDHRGRDKIVTFDTREVTDYLYTIEQARSVVTHRSVWAPLAADPEVSVPIPQGALFALVRYYRDSPRCVGVAVSDERLKFEGGRRGWVLIVKIDRPEPPSAIPRYPRISDTGAEALPY